MSVNISHCYMPSLSCVDVLRNGFFMHSHRALLARQPPPFPILVAPHPLINGLCGHLSYLPLLWVMEIDVCAHLGVGEQLAGVSSLLTHGFQGLNPVHHSSWQAPLPTEPCMHFEAQEPVSLHVSLWSLGRSRCICFLHKGSL